MSLESCLQKIVQNLSDDHPDEIGEALTGVVTVAFTEGMNAVLREMGEGLSKGRDPVVLLTGMVIEAFSLNEQRDRLVATAKQRAEREQEPKG